MSTLVVVGAAASASQLVVYVKGILCFIADLYTRVQETPRQYREYELQLNLLKDIATAIDQNPALQTQQLQSNLDATLVEVTALQAILCRPNRWTSITGSEQEKVLLHLESLHKKNTVLLLCIATVNTDQLSSVMASSHKMEEIITQVITQVREATEEKGEAEVQPFKLLEELLSKITGDTGNFNMMSLARVEKPMEYRKADCKEARNTFGHVTIRGEAIVHQGNVSSAPINSGGNLIVLENEFVETHINGKSIVHSGNVGGGFMGNNWVRVNIDGQSRVRQGTVDDEKTQEQWFKNPK